MDLIIRFTFSDFYVLLSILILKMHNEGDRNMLCDFGFLEAVGCFAAV